MSVASTRDRLPRHATSISIHAPRERPLDCFLQGNYACYFNPRSPRGERPAAFIYSEWESTYFNPHSPRGERHSASSIHGTDYLFQSTLPARGATWISNTTLEQSQTFQSTLPARGATRVKLFRFPPHEFQSTLPARGATLAGSLCPLEAKDFNPRSPRGERPANRQVDGTRF